MQETAWGPLSLANTVVWRVARQSLPHPATYLCSVHAHAANAREAMSRRWSKDRGNKPVVRRALVHATSVLTTRDKAKQILTIDMKPLVIHLLAGLEQAGFERAVITLGHDAAAIAECVTGYGFERLQVDFVYLTLGSATDGKHSTWRNLASSVIAARTAFSGPDPLLIVRAEQLRVGHI